MALLTPGFRTSGLENCEWLDFCCFKPLNSVVIDYNSHRKQKQSPIGRS